MINKFARKQEVAEAARRAGVYDKLCEGIVKVYGWEGEMIQPVQVILQ